MAKKKILVVLDPTSHEQPAVERAAWLAEKLSASLELFICDYDPDIDAGRSSTVWLDQPVRENLLSILHDRLEKAAEPLRKRGIDVAVDVAWDHPLEEGIVRKTAACNPWLVAKDTHHHNLLKRTILSNTDWHLIRECPVPLLLVKPNPIANYPKIFAAVDPLHAHDKDAQLDGAIVDLARVMANGTDSELHVVHSFIVPAAMGIPEASVLAELADDIEKQHQKAFTDFLTPYDIPEGNTHLLSGPAYEVLPQLAANDDTGLIVMGAVSRSGLDKVFVGSTAERVLDRLSCDLLIVKN